MDGWLTVEEGAIEDTLAQNAFPGALTGASKVGHCVAGATDAVHAYLTEHPSEAKTKTNKKLKL
jgi:hypothetical protein